MSSYEDQIKQMYGANLTSQKEQLKSDYEAADQALTLQKEENQKITDSNLRQTRIDAQKSAVNNEEYYAASGLTSGAKAQARLAQDNQLLSNLTTIRTAQQEADALIERQRATLAKEYESAITKAQAENDFALAKALYDQAQIDDEKLRVQQLEAAKLMAEGGDYSLLGQMYGLSNWQTALLGGSEATKTTVKALTSNGVSETDRNAVLNTVRSVYEKLRAGGATQRKLDNYLVELSNAGILQKYEDAEIREDRNWSASASAPPAGFDGTKMNGTGTIVVSGGTDQGQLANITYAVEDLQDVYDDWVNADYYAQGITPNEDTKYWGGLSPTQAKERCDNYANKYGSMEDLANYIKKLKYYQENFESMAAVAVGQHLAAPHFTERVLMHLADPTVVDIDTSELTLNEITAIKMFLTMTEV